MELMVVDNQRANLATLKGLIRSFICDFFGRKNVKMRFRPNYFPFTEPSMEVDIYYHGADSEGWLEVLGCGIVRKNILERCGYKSNGIALGIGIERLCMLRNGITNILDLYKNKHYFLKNFSQKSL
jgi:phenylalanyl-tRNA synthetase alpha chain